MGGSDPKKVLLQFADLVHNSQLLMKHGVIKPPKIKWKEVQKFKSSFTDAVPLSTKKKLSQLGIDCFHQSPVFQNENQVLVEGKLISGHIQIFFF